MFFESSHLAGVDLELACCLSKNLKESISLSTYTAFAVLVLGTVDAVCFRSKRESLHSL